MRKLFLFPVLVAAILGCSNNDDMPCVSCGNQGQNSSSSSSLYPSSSSSSSSLYPSSSSSSSSLYPSSSSSEYTGGSCNAADYGSVNINGQIWMKKNWGCYAPGSKCYGNDPANCTTYGRLYDWSTAMGISSSYNSSYYNPSSSTKYRGVCPEGWHIPNNAEWDRLMRYVDGTSGTSSPYSSPTAGRYLKAKDGWYNCGPTGSGEICSCEDTYGFSALPGGYGNSGGSFNYDGGIGCWWSASEYSSSYASDRGMGSSVEHVGYGSSGKDLLLSVRCVQD